MSEHICPPNHATRLLTTFKHIDEILEQALSRFNSSSGSPFSEFVADATPAQRHALAEHIERLRVAMRGFLEQHQIAIPRPSKSALKAASTACQHAGVAIEELQPRYMRAYGALSPAADAELGRLVAELSDALRKMNASLAEVTPPAERPTPDRPDRAG
jgi:hypothetical protein